MDLDDAHRKPPKAETHLNRWSAGSGLVGVTLVAPSVRQKMHRVAEDGMFGVIGRLDGLQTAFRLAASKRPMKLRPMMSVAIPSVPFRRTVAGTRFGSRRRGVPIPRSGCSPWTVPVDV